MTPKEKAIQLVAKYKSQSFGITTNFQHFKQCALIAVDEVLDSIDWDYYEGANQTEHMYWEEVKQEIEKL